MSHESSWTQEGVILHNVSFNFHQKKLNQEVNNIYKVFFLTLDWIPEVLAKIIAKVSSL